MMTIATAAMAMSGFPGCGACDGILNNNNNHHDDNDDTNHVEEEDMRCTTTNATTVAKNSTTDAITNLGNHKGGDDNVDDGGGDDDKVANSRHHQSHHKQQQQQQQHNHKENKSNNQFTASTTTTSTSSSSKRQRCYRLNLERPFDIHCEQSPLEYGDYMAPWSKEVYPITVGPTEYCPPRHLGGNTRIWQELLLLRRSRSRNQQEQQHYWKSGNSGASNKSQHHHHNGAAQDRSVAATPTTIIRARKYGGEGGEEEEEKVNSLDILDGNEEEEKVAATVTTRSSSTSQRGDDNSSNNNKALISEQRQNDDVVVSTEMVFTMSPSSSSTTRYHCLTSQEQIVVKKRLERKNDSGEFTFEAYDLTHVMRMPNENNNNDDIDDGIQNINSNLDGGRGGGELHTVFSMESSTSEEEDEQLCPTITPEEIAKDTARLFRRSELSMRERLEGSSPTEEEVRLRQRRCCRRRQHYPQQQQQQQQKQQGGGVKGDNPNDANTVGGNNDDADVVVVDIEGGAKSKKKTSRGSTLSKSGKKIFRSFSRALSELQGTPTTAAPLSGMYSSRSGSAGVNGSGNFGVGSIGMDRRSSMQALTINKARDLVDNNSHNDDDDEDVNVVGVKGNVTKTKPLNVSLYIVGEYDILNDLVNDGAKRLRENKEVSDLHLLQQNDPCPPPDRWVRSTGWGRCNPGSMYARYPPEDFDWVRYYDKLRLKTGPSASRVVSRERQRQASRVGATVNDDDLHRQDGTTDTQTTAVVVSSSDLSGDNSIDHQDDHHHIGGRLIKVTRASSSMPISPKSPERELHRSFATSVAQSLAQSSAVSRSNTTPATTASCGNGDGRLRCNQAKAATTLSTSVPNPTKSARSSYAKASSSASTPGSVNGSANLGGSINNTSGSARSSFGRKLSSMLGRKKSSSGAE